MNDNIYTGRAAEHTVCQDEPTVFVVGIQNVHDIESCVQDFQATHVFLGARSSFPRDANASVWGYYQGMAKYFLKAGLWVSLEVDVSQVIDMCESGLSEFHKFVPVISARVPYIDQLGYNAVLKINDIEHGKTNFGVWCHRIHDLKSNQAFTHGNAYDTEVQHEMV